MQAFDYKKQILEPIKSLRGAPREEMYRARTPDLFRLRSGPELPSRCKGRWQRYDFYWTYGLYVCGEFELSLHPLCGLLDPCPDHQWRGRDIRN